VLQIKIRPPRSHLLGPPRFSTKSDDSLQLNANDFFRSSHIEPDPQFACAMVSLSPKRAIAPSTIMLPRCHGAAPRLQASRTERAPSLHKPACRVLPSSKCAPFPWSLAKLARTLCRFAAGPPFAKRGGHQPDGARRDCRARDYRCGRTVPGSHHQSSCRSSIPIDP
jgi:hypothetical protein